MKVILGGDEWLACRDSRREVKVVSYTSTETPQQGTIAKYAHAGSDVSPDPGFVHKHILLVIIVTLSLSSTSTSSNSNNQKSCLCPIVSVWRVAASDRSTPRVPSLLLLLIHSLSIRSQRHRRSRKKIGKEFLYARIFHTIRC
jgi:hypothetical protein